MSPARHPRLVVCAVLSLVLTWACSPNPIEPPDELPDAGTPPTEHQPLGPRIHVAPDPTVSFGQVGFFDAQVDHVAVRKVAVFNVGDAPLKLHAVELTQASATQPSDELEVRLPEGWQPGTDLLAKAGSNVLELELRFRPRELGVRAWTLTLSSSDPERPELVLAITADVVVPPPCELSVSPTRLTVQFGVSIQPATVSIVVRNQGVAPVQRCLLAEVDLEAPVDSPLSLGKGTTTSRVLEAGEELPIPLRVAALPLGHAPRMVEAQLKLQVSAPMREVVIPLRVELRSGGCLVLGPDELDFGSVCGTSGSDLKTVNAYNACGADVVIKSFTMYGTPVPPGAPGCGGTAACPEFLLVSAPAIPSGGLVVRPGDPPFTFMLKYRPLDSSSDVGALAIAVKSEGSDVHYVAGLYGRSAGPTVQSDVFTQPEPVKSDVLFVIDDSPSMANEQALLQSNLSSLLQYVKASGVDFRLAVVTANQASGAAFLTGPNHPDAVLTSSSPNLDAQFAAKVNVGLNGSGSPRCFEQAVAALTPPLSSGVNAGFVRAGAALAVICITDTTDTSPLPVSDHLDDLWAIKGTAAKSLFTFNAVGGFTPSCPGDQGRLSGAVMLTNGTTADLCDPNWQLSFQALGKPAWGQRTAFFLTSYPDLAAGTIAVTIDGQPVAETDAAGATVWSYDPIANSVNFEPLFMPGPGTTLVITYSTACYP